ncbi:MAG: hypothetical protein M1822_002362 [Bathelium mastoideum]|nr:MAG: hypothetical protein M1822_002362 [Bathelium mastoideum]
MDVALPHPGGGILSQFDTNINSALWQRIDSNGRRFYHVDAIVEWMQRLEPGNSLRNAELLIREVRPVRPGFNLDIEKFLYGPDRCLVVLAILVTQKRGHLIDILRRSGIVDQHLTYLTENNFRDLRNELEAGHISDRKEICSDFESDLWSFCPATLSLRMNGRYHTGQYIMPFCQKQQVNEKGGTAQVYEVVVQEDFVPKPLREKLQRAKFTDPKFGACYRMALKTFGNGRKVTFDTEHGALSSFSVSSQDQSLIQYLGNFQHKEQNSSQTYNILLEYGRLDLDEYFACTAPPTSYEEIRSFWKQLFQVANALHAVHQPSTDDGLQYYGWHGDVKPDNILVVNDEFKLADFGFAKFQEGDSDVAMSRVEGGTQTYGAPEHDRARERKELEEVSQAIDIWSFGTVLLLAVTWVVLGNKGIEHFELVRKVAIAKLKAKKERGENVSVPSAEDAFHNRIEALPELRNWCQHLNQCARHCDVFTSRILEMVEDKMLCKEPTRRITCEKLVERIEELLDMAEKQHKKANRNKDLTALLGTATRYSGKIGRPTVSIEAKLGEGSEKTTLQIPLERPTHSSKRIGKSTMLAQAPMPKTSHSEEVMEERLKELQVNVPKLDAASGDSFTKSETNTERVGTPRATKPPKADTERANGLMINSYSSLGSYGSSHLSESKDIYTPPKEGSYNHPELKFTSQTQLATPLSTVDYVSSDPKGHDVSHEAGPFRSPPIPAVANPIQAQSVPIIVSPEQDVVSSPAPNESQDVINTDKALNGTHLDLNSELKRSGADITQQVSQSGKRTSFPTSSGNSPPLQLQPSRTLSIPFNPMLWMQELRQYDIFRTRFDLEEEAAKKGKIRSIFGSSKPDEALKQHVYNRDIVFVVDNGSTMSCFRNLATLIVETLAMKLKGIDDDGFDLCFTNGNERVEEAKKDAPAKFRKAMSKAWSEDGQPVVRTDMATALDRIFEGRIAPGGRGKTLLVITDGVWLDEPHKAKEEREKDERVERVLLDVYEKLHRQARHTERRKITIQFI